MRWIISGLYLIAFVFFTLATVFYFKGDYGAALSYNVDALSFGYCAGVLEFIRIDRFHCAGEDVKR